jgi:hypothetical protein
LRFSSGNWVDDIMNPFVGEKQYSDISHTFTQYHFRHFSENATQKTLKPR